MLDGSATHRGSGVVDGRRDWSLVFFLNDLIGVLLWTCQLWLLSLLEPYKRLVVVRRRVTVGSVDRLRFLSLTFLFILLFQRHLHALVHSST
jgi:hypothetical protein